MTPDPRLADTRPDQLRTTALSALYYGGLGLLLAAIVSGTLASILPGGVARRVAQNSEGYAFALLLAAWIQLVTRRATRPAWGGAVVAALACLLVGIWLFTAELPSAVKTLNETALALAVAIPYVTIRRPISTIAPPVASLGLLLLVVAGVALDPGGLVVQLAETMGFLILLPIALDVVDRGILQPSAVTSTALRWAWYAALVLEVAVVTALGVEQRQGGGIIAATLDYLGRVHESVIGVLLLQLFLAVGLDWTGRRPPPAPHM